MKKLFWVKKHLSNRTAFGEYIGIKPYVMFIFGIVFFYIYLIWGLFIDFDKNIKGIIFATLLIYTLLVIFTYVLLLIDKELGIKKSLKVKTLLFNPIFLLSFLYCMIRAMFGNVKWDKIEHTGNN